MGKVGDQLSRRGIHDDEILRLFREAEQDLVRVVERAPAGSKYAEYRSQQAKAINQIIVRLQEGTLVWAEMEIAGLFEAGAAETRAEVEAFGEKEFELEFAGVDQAAVKLLVDEAYMEFGSTIAAMRRNAERAVLNKRKLAEGIAKGVIQGRSVASTQKELIRILKADGIEVLRARNGFGRRFNVQHYTNMLVRTQSMSAYNLGARAQLLGTGRRFALFPTIQPDIDGEDVCNEWERRKFVDLAKDPLPPASTHPNCRHRVRPVSFAQLQKERPDLYRLAVAHWKNLA